MDFFLKLITPLENYDFSNFLHNFFLALPASVLAGVIIFFLLLAFKKLQSKEYRLYISIALILMIAVTSSLYNIGVKTDTLFAIYTEWLHLIVRWTHIIFGVAWIGTSFYFNWLDSRLERDDPNFKHLDGYLWSVHSGGFYRIEKLKGPPEKLPKVLHWFKWEAYATWISGFVLLILVYYFNASSMMLKNDGFTLTPGIAILISVFLLIGSWFLYDFVCKNIDDNKQELLVIIGFILFVLLSYFLTEIYGSRAAYIHVGAIIGTIMAANVFRVIIPAQKNLVSSAENKQKPNLQLSIERYALIRFPPLSKAYRIDDVIFSSIVFSLEGNNFFKCPSISKALTFRCFSNSSELKFSSSNSGSLFRIYNGNFSIFFKRNFGYFLFCNF